MLTVNQKSNSQGYSQFHLEQFFNHYPHELIEQSISALFKPFTFNSCSTADEMSYMSLLYQELNLVIHQYALDYYEKRSHPAIDKGYAQNLGSIVNFLKETIPAGYIFCVNSIESRTDLIIVIDQDRYKPFDEIYTLLDFAALGNKNINCTVHAYGTMSDFLSRGHIYYSAICIPENCIFQNGNRFSLPILSKETSQLMIGEAQKKFKQSMDKAINFFKGAQQFSSSNEPTIAAFMLQQACELTFRSLILTLRGKEVRCHDLIVLRKHLMHFVPDIAGAFHPNEEIELNILATIQEAYIKSRYDEHYKIENSTISNLLITAEKFILHAQQLFENQCSKMRSIYD